MVQRKDEWLSLNDKLSYHKKQFEKVYRSTELFIEWLSSFLDKSAGNKICDLACGGGANIAYMQQKYPKIVFEGIEINKELVSLGNKELDKRGNRAKIFEGDLYNLNSNFKGRYKGIISFQTLSWLPGYYESICCMTELNPDWIAISSLFYEGDIDYKIECRNYTRTSDTKQYENCFYNIYSLVKIKELFNGLGYKKFDYRPFKIDIDIKKPEKAGLGTYTERLENGKRIQISGGLMLPWYFIVAYK